MKKLCLCINGSSGFALLKGLEYLSTKIIIVSSDLKIIKYANSKNFPVFDNIYNVSANLFICDGYLTILKKDFIKKNLILNIHHSILPKNRGRHSIIWSILNNEKYFGYTIFQMNEFIDDGPIFYQYRFKNIGQTSSEILNKCNHHIRENIMNFLNIHLAPMPYNKKNISYNRIRILNDCIIDLNKDIEYLKLFFRAYVAPFPLPLLKINNHFIEILESHLIYSDSPDKIGVVVKIENKTVWIKVLNGFILINKIRDFHSKSNLDINVIFKCGLKVI